jgi:hypothetical protein
VKTHFPIAALLVVGCLSFTGALADDVASFITGDYAKGLRTMEMMQMIDTDKDGSISQQEWTAFQNKVFSALDKNNTGFVDAKAFYGDPLGTFPDAPGAFILGLRTKAMFDNIGPNVDGKISREQFLRFQQKIFDMMDTKKKKYLMPGDFILGN